MVDQRKHHHSQEALFRFQVVSAVLGYELMGMSRDEAVALAACLHHDLRGNQRSVSTRSVRRYMAAYEEAGVDGLEPMQRKKLAIPSRVIRDEVASFLIEECSTTNESIPELIRRARAHDILRPDEKISRVSVWRMLKRQGLTIARTPRAHPDQRRNAQVHRMQFVLADFVHFYAGPTRTKRLAIYFLDDASRYCLGVAVTTDGEATEVFLGAFYEVLCRFGLMKSMYLDGGPAFKADDSAQILAQLNVGLIMGEHRYPQAHGKIERFNRSAKARILRSLAGDPDVDPGPKALAHRLHFDALEIYNHLPHEGIKGQTPHDRFYGDTRALTPAPSEQHLREHFTIAERRKVTNDNVISFKGTAYDMPCGYSRTYVTLHRRVLEDNHLYFENQGKLIQLKPVDVYLNARTPRAKPKHKKPRRNDQAQPKKSASTIQYEKTYGSVLDQDGGFSNNHERSKK